LSWVQRLWKSGRLLDQNTVSRFPDRRFFLETEIVRMDCPLFTDAV